MFLVFTTLALASPPAWLENEPNNAIEQWEAIEAPATLLGHKGPDSDQDGFWWTVSPEDATRNWTFRLDGVPGAMTRVDLFRVEVAPNGREATGVETVYTLGSRDGSRQVVRDDLVHVLADDNPEPIARELQLLIDAG